MFLHKRAQAYLCLFFHILYHSHKKNHVFFIQHKVLLETNLRTKLKDLTAKLTDLEINYNKKIANKRQPFAYAGLHSSRNEPLRPSCPEPTNKVINFIYSLRTIQLAAPFCRRANH